MFREKHRRYLFIFAFLYIIYGIGLLYSKNLPGALDNMQTKLSLLVFPIIFATIDKEILLGRRIYYLIYAYLSGCFVITLVLFIKATINYFGSSDIYEFYYTNLSADRHSAYLSMYLNFALAMILVLILENGKWMKRIYMIISGILFLWFFSIVFLLSSKAGIVTTTLIFLAGILYIIIIQKKVLHGFVSSFIAIIMFIIAFNIFPITWERFNVAAETISKINNISPDNTESTAERILIWKSASEVVKENFVAGVGLGDVSEHLCIKYQNLNIQQAFDLRLNAHNEYLQTFLASGVIGFMMLILFIVVPAIFSLKYKYLLYFFFLLIIGFNFISESMLCRQAGVVFYSYFNALLIYTWFSRSPVR